MRLERLFKVLCAAGAALTTGGLACSAPPADSGLPLSGANDEAHADATPASDLARAVDMAVAPDLAAVDADGVGSWLKWV
jgi:hypothetical protein